MLRNMILALGLAGVAAACRTDRPREVASAGALPPSVFVMGPQPGPDRVLAEALNPYAGSKTVLPDGRRLFVWFNCSGCHGDHAGGGMGPSLRDSSWIFGGRAPDIFASITEGRPNGMPAWGVKLSRDQIWQIVTYIQSLRTPDEPDAPR